MRVIAGELGGRRLVSPRGEVARPTPDRVREALYSILGSVEGAVVLDLYSGTGALAIEALSRGAARAVLVEKDRASRGAIETNLETLGLTRRAELLFSDVTRALPRLASRGERFDLVLADPPYAEAGAQLPAVLLALPPLLSPEARVVLEHGRRMDSPPAPPGLVFEDSRRYGETALSFYAVGEGTG